MGLSRRLRTALASRVVFSSAAKSRIEEAGVSQITLRLQAGSTAAERDGCSGSRAGWDESSLRQSPSGHSLELEPQFGNTQKLTALESPGGRKWPKIQNLPWRLNSTGWRLPPNGRLRNLRQLTEMTGWRRRAAHVANTVETAESERDAEASLSFPPPTEPREEFSGTANHLDAEIRPELHSKSAFSSYPAHSARASRPSDGEFGAAKGQGEESRKRRLKSMVKAMLDHRRRSEHAQTLSIFDIDLAAKERIPKASTAFDLALFAANRLHDAATARKIHQIMLENGQSIGHVAHGNIIAALCFGESPEAGLEFLLTKVPEHLQTNAQFTVILSSANSRRDPRVFQKALEARRKSNLPLDANFWATMLSYQGEFGSPEDLQKSWEECMASGNLNGEYDVITVRLGHLWGLQASGQLPEAVAAFSDILDTWQELNQEITQKLKVFQAERQESESLVAEEQRRRKSARLERQQQYIQEKLCMRFVQLLSTLEGRNEASQSLPLFQKLIESGVGLNLPTYNCLLKTSVSGGVPPAALEELVSEMQAHGVRPSSQSFNWVLLAYVKRRDYEGARKVIEQMRSEGVQPDTFSYAQLLAALDIPEHLEEAMSIYQTAKSEGQISHAGIFVCLFKGIGKLQHPKAEQPSRALQSTGKDSDEPLSQPEYLEHKRQLNMDTARHFMEMWMEDARALQMLPNSLRARKLTTYDMPLLIAAIKAMGQLSDIPGIFQLLEAALALGFQQSAGIQLEVVFSAALGACGRLGDYTAAQKLAALMEEHGVEWSVHTYGGMINAFAMGRNIAGARQMWSNMLRAGHSPTGIAFNSMIKAELRVGELDRAVELAEALEDAGMLESLPRSWSYLQRSAQEHQRPDIAAAVKARLEGSSKDRLSDIMKAERLAREGAGFGDDSDDDWF